MKTMIYKNTELIKKITFAAACLALCFALPFLTGAIPEIGGMLCPMHIPAFLAGALLGPWIGGAVAFVAPILRGLMFGSPAVFPRGISMAFELCAYAIVFGLLLKLLPKKIGFMYLSLTGAMLVGRVVGGITKIVLLSLGAIGKYGWQLYFTGYFVETIPGVVLQFLLIPPILYALRRAKLYSYTLDKSL